jgi:hypothetical protein
MWSLNLQTEKRRDKMKAIVWYNCQPNEKTLLGPGRLSSVLPTKKDGKDKNENV